MGYSILCQMEGVFFKKSLVLSTIIKLKMVHKKGGKERLMDRALFDLGPQLARFGHLTIIGLG